MMVSSAMFFSYATIFRREQETGDLVCFSLDFTMAPRPDSSGQTLFKCIWEIQAGKKSISLATNCASSANYNDDRGL